MNANGDLVSYVWIASISFFSLISGIAFSSRYRYSAAFRTERT